ncbi:MAG: hypothetical protein AABY14_03525, partial [Nanoarchaeota archaeon]
RRTQKFLGEKLLWVTIFILMLKKVKTLRIIKNILLIGIFFILFLIFFEIFLRIFYPQNTLLLIEQREKTLNIFKESKYLPWELSPGKVTRHIGPENDWNVEVKINSKGLRDREIDYTKPKGTYRILVLGDSFSFGYGVDLNESYGKVLERLLNANSKAKRFEVINAGFASGNSIDTAYIFLKNEGLKYNQDLVIFGFLPSNDIEDIQAHYWEEDTNGLPIIIKERGIYVNKDGNRQTNSTYLIQDRVNILWKSHVFFSKYSYVYTFFKNALKNNYFAFEFRKKFEPKISTIYDVVYSDLLATGWEKSKLLFLETNKLLQSHDVKFVVLYIPDKWQPIDKFWNDYMRIYLKDNTLISRTKPQDILAEFASENNIRFVDIYPMFHSNQNMPLYFNIDPHWTKYAHYLAGNGVYDFLQDLIV